MLRQMEWGVQNGPIIKNRVLPVVLEPAAEVFTPLLTKFLTLLETLLTINRPHSKCWIKDFVLALKYQIPDFYRRFWHILAN